MDEHDQSADANVVGAVGEPKQKNGSDVVYYLFFKILQQKAMMFRHFKDFKSELLTMSFDVLSLRRTIENLFWTPQSTSNFQQRYFNKYAMCSKVCEHNF